MYDVAIVGAGPAGLSAAIALVCEGKSVCLIEKGDTVGGQIAHSHLVENVVGYPQGFNGSEFALQAFLQAINLGVDILLRQQVMMLSGSIGDFALITTETTIHARSILITVGVAPRPLPFAVLMEENGCTVTNELHLQPANPGEHVMVYGGGNSAGQAALYYAKLGCSVTLLSRRPVVETMDGRWITNLANLGVSNIVGEIQHVNNDTVVFESSGIVQHLTSHTLHAFVGGEPVTSWLYGWVELDDKGYILTDEYHCTATYGVFAAGDCEGGSIKKFTCAVGGGCEAVPYIGQYLSTLSGLVDLDASREVVI